MGRQTTGLPQGGGLYPNDPNSMFAINMGGGQAVLKVSVNNPAARAQPVGEEQGKKFSTRRVPQSAAAEAVDQTTDSRRWQRQQQRPREVHMRASTRSCVAPAPAAVFVRSCVSNSAR